MSAFSCMRDQFAPGMVLGDRYRTVAPLNHGSFGMVFMAKDTTTDETVAVKVLTKKAVATESALDFAVDEKSEELMLHRLLGAHPNIVNLIDAFETDSHVYLVLEFCHRGDLYEAIRNGYGPLETEHVRQFMLQLIDSVSYIHSKGVYHRDIKPENIFLSESGVMKLGDFGLATTQKWTMESTVGSDRYMSPEQYDSDGAGYSPAQADIWAIGICLLNILFSRNPFTTPTESDPLFLDFSRDKQSLFDVFPNMSQDTYEVIVQCMNLDPKKRSLEGAREALERVVSFTTSDEILDEFCCAEKTSLATANREPLRTPSIQSPQTDIGTFPWTKALHAAPQPISRLAVIPDENLEEDLFPKSEESRDWCSATNQTPSMSSMVDSSLGASMKSLSITRPVMIRGSSTFKPNNVAGSLPIAMARPSKPTTSKSLNPDWFKNTMSKSWSDIWEEDFEEEQEEQTRQTLKDLNARTWSHESVKTPSDFEGVTAKPSPASVTITDLDGPDMGQALVIDDVDGDLVADGFFFQNMPSTPAKPKADISFERYSPLPKRSAIDKWAALGQRRRRAHTGTGEVATPPPSTKKPYRIGVGYPSVESTLHDHTYHHPHYNTNNHHHFTPNFKSPGKPKAKDCPWNQGRSLNWRREKRPDFGDVEWVGGWQEAH